MIFPLPWVVLFASLLNLCATSPAFDRLACQYPTADPLEGCPANTILVGSSADPNVQFTSIQPAVLSLPNDNSSQIILILAGDYTEQVNVTRSGPLTLLGQTPSPTDQKLNTVSVYWAAVAGTGHNAATSTLTVAPAGAPFGNSDFRAYNIDFVNDYAPYADTPSQALGVSYANAGFYYCGFYSYQDTVCPVSYHTLYSVLTSLLLRRFMLASSVTRTCSPMRSRERLISCMGMERYGYSRHCSA